MAGLLYRGDMDAVRARLTTWWNGGDIGRPVLLLTVPRAEPIEPIEAMPPPEGWDTHYSTRSFAYRVNQAARSCINTRYFAEAVPNVSPDLAPNCLALYLGCHGVEQAGSVWCDPCISDPDSARFDFDPENFYWDFTMRLAREQLRIGKGKFLTAFPDLIEGLDTLAAMRGNPKLLVDLYERPEWVHGCLRRITDRYFLYYDLLYDVIRDEVGGSVFWAWAPGRMAKFQCDFSAMIGPEMFAEFMAPVLREMCDRVGYCMYHWDGPGAIRHLDHLLSIPGLDMIQWTPGEGHEPPHHERWWPLYHRILDAGKKVYSYSCDGVDGLHALQREFGPQFRQFMIGISASTIREAEEIIAAASA
jgi:5-methyltetrahydrofolate--homocysteine methyltransferase